MDHLSVFLVISLILPVLCLDPTQYGFTDNGGGQYYKDGVNKQDGSRFRILMNVEADGNARFSRQGNSYGNGVGSYDFTKGLYYAEGYGKPGLPLSGWDVPSGSGRSSSGRQTSGVSIGGYDDTGSQAGMDQHRRVMEEMERSMGRMRADFGRGGFNTQPMGGQSVINNIGNRMQGKNNGQFFGNSIGVKTINNFGDYYGVKYTRNDNNYDCTEIIVIQGISGRTTTAINDEFWPECTKGQVRTMHWSDPLLVGGLDQNFCAYGQTDFPEQLVVIEDGVCQIKTYSLKSAFTKVTTLGTGDCKKVKSLIQKVQGVLENANAGSMEENVMVENKRELKGLVKTLGTGGSDDLPSGRPGAPAQPVAVFSTNKDNGKSFEVQWHKKKPGWLKKLWIFIKNVFRVLTFQPTKDE